MTVRRLWRTAFVIRFAIRRIVESTRQPCTRRKSGCNVRYAGDDLAYVVVLCLLRLCLEFALMLRFLLSLDTLLLGLHRCSKRCAAKRAFHVLIGFYVRIAVLANDLHVHSASHFASSTTVLLQLPL